MPSESLYKSCVLIAQWLMSDTSGFTACSSAEESLRYIDLCRLQCIPAAKAAIYINRHCCQIIYHLKPNCLCLAVPVAEAFSRFKSRGWDYKVQGLLSVLPSAVWPLVYFNLFSLLLFPWTLSILLSPGLIWYSTNWLHQKVIMLHIIVTLLFLPLFTSNLSTCESCFMRSRICEGNDV